MAVRPARSEVLSTRPIYLPVVPSKELREIAPEGGRRPVSTAALALFIDVVPADVVDIEALTAGLKAQGIDAEPQGDLFAGRLVLMSGTERREVAAAAANALAWARIATASKREYRMLPLRGEIDYESARLHARLHPSFGSGGLEGGRYGGDLLYDAGAVQQVYQELLPRAWATSRRAVVVTDRALAAWDEGEGAWRRRDVIVGAPGLVSVRKGVTISELVALVRAVVGTPG